MFGGAEEAFENFLNPAGAGRDTWPGCDSHIL
jgi:hypothetical protein